jgi:hypothetical protein
MKDVSMQLETNIEKVLKDFPDSKQMARDMLLNSKRFVIDLLNYMSQDYNSWNLRGYTKKEAWKMTCRSVHRVLDDLQGARMSGRDAGDGTDLDHVTATYIWATAKTHQVMDEYLKYQFFEHPAIAAVLARHLAATAVLPDDQLPAKVRALEQTLTKLSSKVDGIQSKVHLKSTKFVELDSTPIPVSPTPPTPILKAKNGPRGGVTTNPPQTFRTRYHSHSGVFGPTHFSFLNTVPCRLSRVAVATSPLAYITPALPQFAHQLQPRPSLAGVAGVRIH